MIIVKDQKYVGKLDEEIGVINDLTLCTFAMVMTNSGPAEACLLRKLGSLDLAANSTIDIMTIDLDHDTDIYRDYVKLTTGVSIASANSMPHVQ
jgi:hypothetical protein